MSSAREDRIRRDQKLTLLAAAVADYENEFGEIAEEIVAQRRADRQDLEQLAAVSGRHIELIHP